MSNGNKREMLKVKGKTFYEIVDELKGGEWAFGSYATEFASDLQQKNPKINVRDKKWQKTWGIEWDEVVDEELEALQDAVQACKS